MNWQTVRVELRVTLDVRVPSDARLEGNRPAFQKDALVNNAVDRWARHARNTVNLERTDVGVTNMGVQRA